ncbi:hypothetical protein GUJ93_ZPchr0008g12917 [Zizania palustris]|uniref:Uncharacterized protein n=1 Tax=Zizania palustris TaxID=103762 RepID=A0A8J5RVC7_ZIZPA|nr:hypothetical protein GUJ93_ZPchr0008g12917 [Zizania palustris]
MSGWDLKPAAAIARFDRIARTGCRYCATNARPRGRRSEEAGLPFRKSVQSLAWLGRGRRFGAERRPPAEGLRWSDGECLCDATRQPCASLAGLQLADHVMCRAIHESAAPSNKGRSV